MLFSERYSDSIVFALEDTKDDICNDIDYSTKENLSSVMIEYAEPTIVYPNRYDNWEIRTTVLELAIEEINNRLGYRYIDPHEIYHHSESFNPLAAMFSPFLFDVIELQYQELSDGEKKGYQHSINAVFENHNAAWLLHEGRMIKVDSKQFEMDLNNKALMNMNELKDADPKFTSAYNELLNAYDFYSRKEYGEAINNAEKSLESVLKVACAKQRGNSDRLTTYWINAYSDALPTTMKAEGFREKVLMSLPYIRNNTSAAHGSGEEFPVISKHLAKLALNLAASLDTYIASEYRDAIGMEK